MSRMIHRRPKMVIRIAHQMLQYLNNTPSLGLRYWPVAEESEDWRTLRVLAETSFAPPHEKYRSVQAVTAEHGPNLLAWESSRQALVTQSTAEAGLVGYNDGFQISDATAALCEAFEISVKKSLVGDCKAALAHLLGDTGPWRTRHLRLRSLKLREALNLQNGQLSAEAGLSWQQTD